MTNMPLNQESWSRMYSNEHRPEFNEFLYKRDDYDTIEALKNVILSCERDIYFTIKVTNFTVVEDYAEIQELLYNYEQEKIDRSKNNKNVVNPYEYINVKDSDIMLLVVDYFLSINNPEKPEQDTLRVLIKVPRIVDKYYYRIGGNLFSAVFQIVDGSTYNNTLSNSKKQSITMKTIFMPIRYYRNVLSIKDYYGNDIKYQTYVSRIHSKNIPVIEYFFAEKGLHGGLEYLGLDKVITINDTPIGNPNETYCFEKNGMFIEAPKYIFDRDLVTQCVMTTINRCIAPKANINDVKDINYWRELLSVSYGPKPSVERGMNILDSLRSIYDISTKEDIRLPEKDKEDIFAILRWMLREFQAIRLKENTDVSTKKIRRPECIAAIYSTRLVRGIYLATDVRKITMKNLQRYLDIKPDYLINNIVKDKLVGFRNNVNDNDGVYALKFSYKGISGLGGDDATTNKPGQKPKPVQIPDSYRHVDPSHIGRIDPDASSATDPGLAGLISPLAKTYGNSFADEDYMEPNSWEEEFNVLMEEYRQLVGKEELVKFHNSIPDIFGMAGGATVAEMQDIESKKQLCLTGMDAIMKAESSTVEVPNCEDENGNIIIMED